MYRYMYLFCSMHVIKIFPPSSSLGWPAGESSSSSQQQQQQQLSRLQLWRLLRDCNIHHLTPSIFDTDPVTTTASQGGPDPVGPVAACHQPWRPFLMRDFLQALTLLSHNLYHHSSGGVETVRWGIGCSLAVFMLAGYCKISTELCSTATCTGTSVSFSC